MMKRYSLVLGLLAVILVGALATKSLAVPYASAVRLVTGSTWEFVLNENANAITITRDGGSPIVLNNPSAGRHTFNMTGFTNFEIAVTKNAPTGWNRISNSSDPFVHFEQPTGIVVNKNPASPYFGTVYVNNSRTAPTASGRQMGDGVYALTGDLRGVNLANFSVLADPNDVTQAKAPGWNVGVTQTPNSTASAWRLALDAAGNLIATDWSDQNGGIKYATANLTSGGIILSQEAGPTGGVQNSNGEFIHGSIVSKPYVTGTVGVDLTVYGMDEDLETVPFVTQDGNSVWRWNVGAATNYDGVPELVVNVGNIPPTTHGGSNFLNLNLGVLADSHFEPRFNKWYLTQNRNDGTESGIAIVTADGIDGNFPTLEWSSGQFSIDNNLDGWFDDPVCAASIGIQDIFRNTGSIEISDDGTKMFLHRVLVPPTTVSCSGLPASYDNAYLGQNSNLPGSVLVIPLDANGLPDIQIDNNGTPADPTDDFITNMESITIEANNSSHRPAISLDAAGNIYVGSNFSERMEVWSNGGNTRAVTTSAGTFQLQFVTGPSGDFNNDGFWNCADINALTAAVASGSTNLAFDMNGDGVITLADVTDAGTGWLTVGGANNPGATNGNAFRPGDANLDGLVDGSDFGVWNANKFTTTNAWCSGDLNADGGVDGSDFGVWNSNKFTASDDGAMVPEPHSAILMAIGIAVGWFARRR